MRTHRIDPLQLATVAAAFSRAAPDTHTLHDAARDALAFMKLATAIKSAPGPAPAAYAKAQALAARYGARVHAPKDPLGMSVGLTFSPRVHVSGVRSILFVC